MRSLITEQLASRIVDEVLREAMTSGPPEGYKPSYYDDGDPSTDPFEDRFPYLVPKYPQSPYPSDSEETLPYPSLIDPNFNSPGDPMGPIKIIQDIVDWFRSRK